jgi:periplasmic glucans biosynthesis protein
MHRRQLLGAAAALPFVGALSSISAAGLKSLGPARSFDYATLKGRARELAGQLYTAPSTELPPPVAALDWDQYQSIRFKSDRAVFGGERLRFQVRLFHLGLFFKRRVHIFELRDGRAQELAYDPAMFDYGKSGLRGELPPDLGFAGFRVGVAPAFEQDVVAFLGASYFRAVGGSKQYGLSARGLAIDTAFDRPEEFPDFTHFYIERPTGGSM